MKSPDIRPVRARATARGSTKETSHWWAERVSAIALIPLTLWFVASIIAHTGSDYATFTAWLSNPLAAIPMVFLLIALFHHTVLGLEVVIGDYMHSRAKFAVLVVMRLSCIALAIGGIIATLRIALAG